MSNNEALAREGIDTNTSVQSNSYKVFFRNNEALAREGIDTIPKVSAICDVVKL